MCFSICKDRLVGWLVIRCIVQRDAQTNQKGSTAVRPSQWGHVSGPGDVLPSGCFPTCKKNQAHQRNMYHNKYTPCFQTALEPSPSDKSRHSKGILCLISITLRHSQKNYASCRNHLELKNTQKCHGTRLYDKLMHI